MWKLRSLCRAWLLVVVVLTALAAAGGALYAAVMARAAAPPPLIAGMREKVIGLPEPRLAQLRSTKHQANLELLRQNYFVRDGIAHIRLGTKSYELLSLDKMEFTPTAAQLTDSQKLHPSLSQFSRYILEGPAVLGIVPNTVDHRANQTSIKDQGNRGTCVCFASMAGLEVAYGGGSRDFSEQYANYLYMKEEGHGCKSSGLETHKSADYLSANGVCTETICPYQNDKYNFPAYCSNGADPGPAQRVAAEAADRYRIKSYRKIWRSESLRIDAGTWINNPGYLESLLASGKDIVFGTHVAGWTQPYTGIIDVQLGPGGDPLPSVGGHAMLIVGYDRPQEYFIVKNSWGTTCGQSGYVYLSYDYIRTYSKYGYVIDEVEPVLLRAPVIRAVPRVLPR